MLFYYTCGYALSILGWLKINFINKRIYVKVEVNNSINKNGDVYINLYDYKKKNEILPRAIVRTSDLEEFKLNKNLVTSINYKEKIKYKYFNF